MKPFRCVAIVGVGLIGSSIGLALRARELAERVVGIARRPETVRMARRAGAVTNTSTELTKGVAGAELVIVCTPVGDIVDHVREAALHCAEGALITDAGSAKQAIVAALDSGLPRGCRFLGGHPLAGSEKTGPSNAHADLFQGRVAVLTPTAQTRAEDFDALAGLWTALGSVIVRMTAEEHDRALAIASHLPHAVASALASVLPEGYYRLAATGFLDTTRIAAGDPALWVQIFSQNRENILAALDQFGTALQSIAAALRKNDLATLEQLFLKAKNNRDALGN